MATEASAPDDDDSVRARLRGALEEIERQKTETATWKDRHANTATKLADAHAVIKSLGSALEQGGFTTTAPRGGLNQMLEEKSASEIVATLCHVHAKKIGTTWWPNDKLLKGGWQEWTGRARSVSLLMMYDLRDHLGSINMTHMVLWYLFVMQTTNVVYKGLRTVKTQIIHAAFDGK